jgi:L,D-peptidoglycan transpeptidase YkuD (ErfK/YbiS/YcfS/YnhG family)
MPNSSRIAQITVHADPLRRQSGLLIAGALRLRVAIGRAGVTHAKREGDGASPSGRHRLLRLWRRPDRPAIPCGLPIRTTRRHDLWCDAAGHGSYNRPVRAPFAASHEVMWRDDHLYDYVVEIGWNVRPRAQKRGSAIFLHLARADLAPTAGCVAVRESDIRKLLPHISRATRLVIRG